MVLGHPSRSALDPPPITPETTSTTSGCQNPTLAVPQGKKVFSLGVEDVLRAARHKVSLESLWHGSCMANACFCLFVFHPSDGIKLPYAEQRACPEAS